MVTSSLHDMMAINRLRHHFATMSGFPIRYGMPRDAGVIGLESKRSANKALTGSDVPIRGRRHTNHNSLSESDH